MDNSIKVYRVVLVTISLLAVALGLHTLFTFHQAEITIAWSTASEVDVAGYNIWRSEQANGQYVKVNDRLVPPQGDTISGADYQFVDRNVMAGKTYNYQLESVDPNGSIDRLAAIEVEAQNGAWVKLLSALGLFLACIFGMMMNSRHPVNKRS